MADALPTADDFFSAAPAQAPQAQPSNAPDDSSLPSARDFFGTSDKMVGTYSGAANDTVWSSMEASGARILNSTGLGFENKWGSEPIGLTKEQQAALTQAGIFSDYKKNNETFFRAANEGIIRGLVDLGDIATRTVTSSFYGAGAGLEQAAREVQPTTPAPEFGSLEDIESPGRAARSFAAWILGGAGELVGSVPERVPEVPMASASASRVAEFQRARAVGVIGEGEEGFHETAPLTPENLQARTAAAQEAGVPAVQRPPMQNIHDLARSIDPEAFRQFDSLPLIDKDHLQQAADVDSLRQQDIELSKRLEALPTGDAAAAERLARVETVERNLQDEALSGEERRTLSQRRDELLTDTTPEKLREAAAPIEERRVMEAQRAQIADQLSRIQAAETSRRVEQAITPSSVSISQVLQELQPRVDAAYRYAREIAPHLPEEGVLAAEPKAAGSAPPAGVTRARPAGQAEPRPAVPEAEPVEGTPNRETRPRGAQLRPVQGTGEFRTRGLAQGVEAKAIEDGLAANFGDLPEYRQLSMAEQAEAAKKLIDTDYETAKAIALGRKQPPKGLLPESVFVGVEKRALAEGDVETMRQLATQSRLSTEATTMGQRIRTLGERDPASPVGAIQEVQRAREAAFEAREKIDAATARANTISDIKREVRKSASKQNWASFVESIKCEA